MIAPPTLADLLRGPGSGHAAAVIAPRNSAGNNLFDGCFVDPVCRFYIGAAEF